LTLPPIEDRLIKDRRWFAERDAQWAAERREQEKQRAREERQARQTVQAHVAATDARIDARISRLEASTGELAVATREITDEISADIKAGFSKMQNEIEKLKKENDGLQKELLTAHRRLADVESLLNVRNLDQERKLARLETAIASAATGIAELKSTTDLKPRSQREIVSDRMWDQFAKELQTR
jgi:chromosome segregation ATPase